MQSAGALKRQQSGTYEREMDARRALRMGTFGLGFFFLASWKAGPFMMRDLF